MFSCCEIPVHRFCSSRCWPPKTRKAKVIHYNMKLTLTILCQYPGVLQCLGILVGCKQPVQDNQVSPTVMQLHEMPMFLLQQDFSIKWHVITKKQPVHMPVLLNHQVHHHSHKSPFLYLL